MVAHEIRNALVPVRDALDGLYRDAERNGNKTLLVPHQDAIDAGIERIFKFSKVIVNVAERGVEPTEVFDLVPAIEGALAAVASDLGTRAALHHDGNSLPSVVGHRDRFTLAIVNLLRNAAQARADSGVNVNVSIGVTDGGRVVVIMVDDNGPGVPLGSRETIFMRGVSMRPGGTGEGLALVREVVESEMHGRVVCEQSPLGGARFAIKIPAREKR